MKQEQPPKNAAVPAETFSPGGYISANKDFGDRRGNDRIMEPFNPGNEVVTSEDMNRMQKQIKEVFESSDNPERLGNFESNRSALRQGADMVGLSTVGFFAKLGLDHRWVRPFLFRGNNKDKKRQK